ncbi:MAG: S16 family serine protease [archaeon]
MRPKTFLIICAILLVSALAASGQIASSSQPRAAKIKLLAVSEDPEGFEGSIADMSLVVAPGTGRLFMDTFPLSKLDTQLSTRFAKEYVCGFLEIDCQEYDFFYTIRSESHLVGGPSAGAAAAILTYASLTGKSLDGRIAITGTLNSGGLIGPVGGIKEKIEAAGEDDISIVLIPSGERFVEVDNQSLDLVEHGRDVGVDVREISTLDDALEIIFQVPKKQYPEEIELDPSYVERMRSVSRDLCGRALGLRTEVYGLVHPNQSQDFDDLYRKGVANLANGTYYAAASYCYGSALGFGRLLLEEAQPDEGIMTDRITELRSEMDEFAIKLDMQEIQNINDLQTKMVVVERLIDARDLATAASLLLDTANASDAITLVAAARERYQSAVYWTRFFGMDGPDLEIDSIALRESCVMKIGEAQQRLSFVRLYFPLALIETSTEIEYAREDYFNKNYALCLFKAAKAQAEANVVLSLLGIEDDNLNATLDRKMALAKRSVQAQQEKGLFPIIGYSYYEYAESLRDEDPSSAMVYAEYALELSNLDTYFQRHVSRMRNAGFDSGLFPLLFSFITGILFGLLIALLIWRRPERDARHRR